MKSIYNVVLNGSAFSSRAAPGDGFFDPKGSYSYMDEGNYPTDPNKAIAKSRGQRRFKNLIMQIHGMTNAYVLEQTVDGGSADVSPTQISLKLLIEHGDPSLVTDDEYNAGTRLTGIAALRRCIARSFLIEEDRNMETYDTTETTYSQNGAEKHGKHGISSNIAHIGPLADNIAGAEAAITITKVS